MGQIVATRALFLAMGRMPAFSRWFARQRYLTCRAQKS
jgi:hypothetical protein